MRPAFPLIPAALFLGLAMLSPPAWPSAPPGPADTVRSALESLADPQRQAASDNLDAATKADEDTARLRRELAELASETAAAPERARSFERQLQASPRQALAAWREGLPARADIEVLEGLLERERREAEALSERIATLTADLGAALAPDPGARASLEELQRRREELAAPVVATEDEPAALTESRRVRQAAERKRLEAELALRESRETSSAVRQRAQELELRLLRQRLVQHEPRLLWLQQRIRDQSRASLQALVEDVSARADALPADDPVLAEVAATNLAMAGDLLAANEQLAEFRQRLAVSEQDLAADRAALRDSRTRLDLGGNSEQVGTWLWAVMRRLEFADVLEERLADTQQALADTRLRLIALDERQRGLADASAQAAALRAEAARGDDQSGPGVPDGRADPLEAWLDARHDLAARLEPMLWRQAATLEQTERVLQARLTTTRELRQLLDRHLLWIRSHAPVDLAWFGRWPGAAMDLVKAERFATTGRLLARSIAERPAVFALAVMLLSGLVLLRRRARTQIEALGQGLRDVRQDSYRRTLQSLAWTVVAALPGAAALWLGGELLQGIGERGKYSDSLGQAVQAVALPALTLSFLGWMVRERGLAHAHFRWTRQRREALQAWLPALKVVLLPAYFIVALGFVRDQDLAIDVPARIAVVVASVFSAACLAWLLGPDRIRHARGAHPEPSRFRRALRLLLPAALAASAVLALQGYVYSTAIVLDAQFASVGVFIAVAVLHGLLARWFALGERRLALRRQEQKREAELQARAEGATPEEGGGEAIPVDVDEDLALDKVNAQTRRLLRAVKLVLLAAGLVWVWADVLPAFARLDEVVLWSVAQATADGGDTTVPITLMAALLGVLALALTFVAARNLPGLLEIGLLSKVNMDSASRYAITSVSRYAIVTVGIIAGLGLLGLRWGQLQWLAAALTVGLGFGLQEIFANFVSGLILLFERPFRVGDVITVNNLDGTVTRIRTRATTILDFDNKEIVVPNKSFITGQLVNWTLSDETTRIVVKVGVDYGTDPALVHRLLMQAATENPRVLETPPPRSWLLEFGANSLDFELRVFVGGIIDRLAVRNELNVRLVELFAENEVGFAFPQLDVHVRDLPEAPGPGPAPSPGPGSGSGAAPETGA
ncbi:mechanosensitive ion channel domain-containing protein [Arenimonas sp.]|uniref:mechanosensitive ion channel domain-containing protein n=1 Tax=Arenimonas sp. TaxID=1872635 RepID=UPI0035B4C583